MNRLAVRLVRWRCASCLAGYRLYRARQAGRRWWRAIQALPLHLPPRVALRHAAWRPGEIVGAPPGNAL